MNEPNQSSGEEWLIPNVKSLETFTVPDDVPNVQFSPLSVEFEAASFKNPTSFADHNGFQSNFGAEMDAIAQIETLLDQGQYFVHMLYTFRSVAKAIPMIQDPQAPNRNEINMKTFEILHPQVDKLKELMDFQEHAVRVFCNNITHLVTPEARQKIVPEGLYSALIKVVDLLQKLDNLKDMKASLCNDFARFRRAFGGIQDSLHDGDVISDQVRDIQMFLSNPQYPKNFIFHKLRENVKRIAGHEDILIEMLLQCVDHLEEEIYVTPDEKYRLIRSLPHLLLLIDGEGEDSTSFNIFKNKKLKLNNIMKLFQKNPVVTEYGDMAIQLQYILARAPHYDSESMDQNWEGARDVEQLYDLRDRWASMRNEYTLYMSSFSEMMGVLNNASFSKSMDTMGHASYVYREILRGFRHLQHWTSHILDSMSWKFTHPCSDEVLAQSDANMESPTINYERVIRYNFTSEELSALVDCSFMIKSCASAMSKAEAKVAPLIRLHIHHTVQQLVQGDLLPVLHRVDKKKDKKRDLITGLLQLRGLVADWLDGRENSEDYKAYRRAHGRVSCTHPPRVVGPSSTQLHLMRTMVRALYDVRSDATKSSGLFGRKDLEKEDIAYLQDFFHESYSFPYLSNYSGTLRACSDLGDLWYREFYLELTQCVQFPIELSLPWILTEHVIVNQTYTSPMVENILYTLDVYNDAAHRALYVLNQQFLYDEIEAEVNLVFDQLVFLISDEMFSHFKNTAASSLLDKEYRQKLEGMKGVKYLSTQPRRYEIPMSQRHIQLLGRSIDLNFLIGQHINNTFYRDIEVAIKRFESGDISGVVDLETLLNVMERTHSLLSDHLELDVFDTILSEVNESISPTSFRGRIALHVLRTLVTDLFPNYSYNLYTQRFVRSPVPLKPATYDNISKNIPGNLLYGQLCGKAYDHISKLHRYFAGHPHWRSMIRVLGHADLPLVIDEVLRNLEEKLMEVQTYVDALRHGIPPCKLPKYMWRTGGCYGFFEGRLRPILEYDDLKPEVFQNLREIGNMIAFLKDVSDILDVEDGWRFMLTSPLFGFTPEHTTETSNLIDIRTTPFGGTISNFVGHSSQMPTFVKAPGVVNALAPISERVLTLYKNIPGGGSLFRSAINRVDQLLDEHRLRDDWRGSAPKNGAMDVEDTSEFYRLWSALNFLFCMFEESSSDEDQQMNDEDEFGHGFAMGGCIFVYLLGAQSRFELLDFSYHVINVAAFQSNATLSSDAVASDPQLEELANLFLVQARRQKSLHRAIFDIYRAAFPEAHTRFPNNAIFHPPSDDTVISKQGSIRNLGGGGEEVKMNGK